MRVLVCPTAFKGTLGAAEAAAALAEGARRALPGAVVREMPLSDGGPGLIDALRSAGQALRSAGQALRAARPGGARDLPIEEVAVRGPLGDRVHGRILWQRRRGEKHAVLESADACGLHRVPEGAERPLEADTRGVGELISAALERGADRIIVGLGGSATTDGGTGMARSFGHRFLDAEGRELPPGGGALVRLARIEVPDPGSPSRNVAPSVPIRIPITALADVQSPLNGAAGAARRFGPQKGATREELDRLVRGLERLSERLAEDLGRPEVGDMRPEVGDMPGSGAAGGLAAGLAAFLGAEIRPGSDWVLERVGFAEALAVADLVVTGEGAWDASSEAGKITGRVLDRARRAEVPALLVCGRLAGPVPAGVRAADAGGDRLDAEGLAELAAREVARG